MKKVVSSFLNQLLEVQVPHSEIKDCPEMTTMLQTWASYAIPLSPPPSSFFLQLSNVSKFK
jgi:hypothetical protein